MRLHWHFKNRDNAATAGRFCYYTESAVSVLILTVMALFSFAGSRPTSLGVYGGRLAPCPATPNCVSSDADDSSHAIRPFELAVPPAEAWRVVLSLVSDLPRTQIVTATSDYIHTECASAVFGFVDDLELHLRPSQNIIAVRSASRLGYGDFGVNRRRVENLRSLLVKRGVLK